MTTSKRTPQQPDLLTSSPPAGRAKTSVSQVKVQALMEHGAVSSLSWPELLAMFDLDSSSWRTSQLCLFEGLTLFSGDWPRSGMTVNGIAYRLPVLALRTDAIGSGLLPTPTASDYGTNTSTRPNKRSHPSLQTMARQNLWPTPTASDGRSSGSRNTSHSKANEGISLTDAVRQDQGAGRMVPTPDANTWKGGNRRRQLTDPSYGVTPDGGQLNPTWVEWLMGFPEGWTDLED